MTETAARAMADKIGAVGYFETSAKENEGVKELFAEAVQLALTRPEENKKGSSGCCIIA